MSRSIVRKFDPGGAAGINGTGVATAEDNTAVHIHRGILGDTDAAGGFSDLVSTGDTFGEAGLIGSVPRTANVVARSPCEVLVLSADFFQRFLTIEIRMQRCGAQFF